MTGQNETDVFLVAEDSKFYPGFELRVKRWKTIQEGIHDRAKQFIHIVDYRPDRSIKIVFTSGKLLSFWFPLSQCELVVTKQTGLADWFL